MSSMRRQQRAKTCVVAYCLLLGGCGVGNGQLSIKQQTLTAAASVSQRAPELQVNEANLIRLGHSIGLLRLGDTYERMIELLGKKPQDEEYTYDAPCSVTEFHWLDPRTQSDGLFIYLEKARIFQIQSAMPLYRTAEGITVNSLPRDVRHHYSQLQAYVLHGSGIRAVGGRDLIYWIDRQQGIAFEFYYNREKKQRRVSKVIVFDPGSDFKPEGCVSSPQEWCELEPYALETSNVRPYKPKQQQRLGYRTGCCPKNQKRVRSSTDKKRGDGESLNIN